jgi:hypothetical protein
VAEGAAAAVAAVLGVGRLDGVLLHRLGRRPESATGESLQD